MTEEEPTQEQVPTFTVAKGSLTPEEMAAVTVVLAALGSGGPGAASQAGVQSAGWRSRRRMMPAWAGRYGWGLR